jgi:hypothetical protein
MLKHSCPMSEDIFRDLRLESHDQVTRLGLDPAEILGRLYEMRILTISILCLTSTIRRCECSLPTLSAVLRPRELQHREGEKSIHKQISLSPNSSRTGILTYGSMKLCRQVHYTKQQTQTTYQRHRQHTSNSHEVHTPPHQDEDIFVLTLSTRMRYPMSRK